MSRALVWILSALVLSPATIASAQARAPYLQSPTETSMIVAWRSVASEPSRVCWGTSADALTNSAGTGTGETDHAVQIAGLAPDTQYFYSAAETACPPATPGDARDTFRTAPPRGTTGAFRLWVVGDSGTGGARQAAVRDAMLGATADRRPDLFLHMGDMAYDAGRTSEFDTRFFDVYADILRDTPCWPTMGNHEGMNSDSATQTGPYYEAYVLPTDGSAGGVASGTEAYYSFDWANVHFVVLDSHDSPRGTTGAMLTWLDEDLAATDAQWIVAYFHHPPYTDGSHDSDIEIQHVQMRQNAVPILEAYGVDLVLGGHSHIYERSWLIHGAYDTPTTAEGHIVDSGDGQLDGDGPYHSGPDGALYVVAGHGGASTSGDGQHPVMYFSEVDNGSCIVDVDGDSLTLRNIRWDGVETDHVTLVKTDGLFLATPATGDRYLAGSIVPITWSSSGGVTAVRIEASLDGGRSWTTVSDRTENDGAFDWSAPRRASELVRIRIRDVDDPSRLDESGNFALAAEATITAIPFGATWQYADDGTDQGETWRMGEGTWSEGAAELGYGEGDEATVLNDADPNVPTVYFRRRIDLANEVSTARIRAVYDDGIAVWVNGTLVTSDAVDDGLDFGAWASATTTEELTFDRTIDLSTTNPFVVGENWIAVIVKQASETSSDVSFDLDLELGLLSGPLDPDDAGVPDGDAGASDAAIDADAGAPMPASSGCGCRAAGATSGGASLTALAMLGIVLALVVRRRR